MNFETIPTGRLMLRVLADKDYTDIFARQDEAEIRARLGILTDSEYTREVEKYRGGYFSYNRRFMMFQLMDKDTGLIIGRCGLHSWSPQHFCAELGYDILREEHKRRGLMSEAVKAVLHFGFTRMGLHRVEAMTRPDNIPSIKIIQNNNFRQEGHLRQNRWDGTHFTDSLLFGLLKEEWENTAGQKP